MKHRAIFLLLALVLACHDDATMLSPDGVLPTVGSERPATVSNPAHGGWSFTTVASLLRAVDPGETRITPGNVLHTKGLVNEFELSGDLEGLVYFEGDLHNRLLAGNGPIIGVNFYDVTAPQVGTLTCRLNAVKLTGFGTPDVAATGKTTHCVGTGDYADKGMKGTLSLRSDATTWDIAGKIF